MRKQPKAPEGAVTGAGTGGVVGGALGWLVGIGPLAIPASDSLSPPDRSCGPLSGWPRAARQPAE